MFTVSAELLHREKSLFSELHCNATTLGVSANIKTRSLSRKSWKCLPVSKYVGQQTFSMETWPKNTLAPWQGTLAENQPRRGCRHLSDDNVLEKHQ